MATQALRSTHEVSLLLGVRPSRIAMSIWEGRLVAPQKLGRSYAWASDDIARLARLFKVRWPRPETPPPKPPDLVQATARPAASATAPVPTPAGRDRTFGIEAKP